MMLTKKLLKSPKKISISSTKSPKKISISSTKSPKKISISSAKSSKSTKSTNLYKKIISSALAKGYEPKYILSGDKDGLKLDKLATIFNNFGLSPANSPSDKVIFKFQFGVNKLLDKRYYATKSFVSNYLDNTGQIGKLTNKAKLYLFIKEQLPLIAAKYMSDTLIIDTKRYNTYNKLFNIISRRSIKFPGIYIIKPGDELAFAGADIHITNELTDMIKHCVKLVKRMTSAKDRYISISKYITNPLLLNGHKFHIRAYIVLFCDGLKLFPANSNSNKYYFPKCIEFILSNKPYTLNTLNPLNPAKLDPAEHISHVSTCQLKKCSYMYPFELSLIPDNVKEKIPKIMSEIDSLFGQITGVIDSKSIKQWSDSQHGFEIFAADLLYDLDRDGVVLMEINHKPGFNNLPFADEITKLLFGIGNILKL